MIENVPLLQLITKSKCDATAVNNDGDTALHIACKTGNPKLIKVVFNPNSDAQMTSNMNGDTPVHIACRLGSSLLLDMLQKSDICRREFRSLIHVACKNDHTHIVTILLAMDVDINIKDKNGDTPLHVACREGHVNTCVFLLNNKCDINTQNANGNTPLHLTCQSGALQICEQLLKRHSNINTKNNNGDTPLLVAGKYCDFEIIQKILSEADIKPNETNHAGDIILHVLC